MINRLQLGFAEPTQTNKQSLNRASAICYTRTVERPIPDEIPGGDVDRQTFTPILNYAGRGRKPRRRLSPVWRVLGAGVAILVALQIIGGLVAPISARAWDARYDAMVSSTLPPGRYASAYFTINGDGIGRGSSMRMQYGLIMFCGQATPGALSFDLDRDTCWVGAFTGQVSGPFPLTPAAVLMYVQRADYVAGDPQARVEADRLWNEILRMRTRPLAPQSLSPAMPGIFQYTPTRRRFLPIDIGLKGSEIIGLPWYTPWVLLVWLFLWAWTARRILRKNKRRES